jgi:LemA protein
MPKAALALREAVMLALAHPRSRTFIRALALAIAGLALAGCGINTIPTLQERAKASWSEVLNQYQRRADLIPNLVETVKGYAAQESKVLTEVVEARAKATQMQIPPDILTNPEAFKKFQEVQGQLTGSLARLLAVVENYPDLKSNQNFLALQSQLEGTENRIAIARGDYIKAVQAYNTEIRTIPGRWWRAVLYPDAEPMQNFTVAEETTKVPEVKF